MRRIWSELTTKDFAHLDPERTVVVLPVAAVEQHGPHLPIGTDTMIAEALVNATMDVVPEDLAVLGLPTQTIGKSNEHIRSAGTLTWSAETAIRAWTEIGESVHRAGLRKLVIVSAHGGNAEVIGIVARDLRVRFGMLAVQSAFSRFGYPDGLYTDQELRVGIHGGAIETSLMLHFRPDLVRLEDVADFTPVTTTMARDYAWLRPTGHTAFAWLAHDLHPSGAIGDARAGTAEKGRRTAEHIARAFAALLADVARFPLSGLAS